MTTQLEQQMPFRYHVGVRVSTEHSEPQRITVMLGLQPHRASRRGEVPQEMEHLGEKVRGVYERHHKWAASFEPLSPTEPLNACLKGVASHLRAHSDALAELAKDGDITLTLIPAALCESHLIGLSLRAYAQSTRSGCRRTFMRTTKQIVLLTQVGRETSANTYQARGVNS